MRRGGAGKIKMMNVCRNLITRNFSFAILAIILAFPASVLAQENALDVKAPPFHPEWRVCQKDEDCTVARGCFDAALNKKYRDQFIKDTYFCISTGAHFPDAVAKCVNAQCTLMKCQNAVCTPINPYGPSKSDILDPSKLPVPVSPAEGTQQ